MQRLPLALRAEALGECRSRASRFDSASARDAQLWRRRTVTHRENHELFAQHLVFRRKVVHPQQSCFELHERGMGGGATAGGVFERESASRRSGPWAPRSGSDRSEAFAKLKAAYLRLRRAPRLPCRHCKQRRDHEDEYSHHRGAPPEEKRSNASALSARVRQASAVVSR